MPANYVLLEKITVGAAGASSVTFSSIPQTGYTDLVLKFSTRSTTTSGASYNYISLQPNGSTTSLNFKFLYGLGSSAASESDNSIALGGYSSDSSTTSNTFSNGEIYIPNYAGSNYKSFSSDSVTENNSTSAMAALAASLWSNTAAITSLTLTQATGNFAQYSTFYLYGVAALGTTPAIAPYATGGDVVTTDGTYWYHAFKATGTFTPRKSLSCDVLVVAGGGSGATMTNADVAGGGGGAGGIVGFASQSLTATGYAVTVGAGASAPGSAAVGVQGSNSVFGALTAAVGGGGGGYYTNGGNGGSGGGAGGDATNRTGGTATSGGLYVGGGGGGAGAVGANALSTGGAGGAGVNTVTNWGALSSVLTATGLGVSGFIAGGGGGGGRNVSPGAGGSGGGGTGGQGGGGGKISDATNGTANTGSGGGGAGSGSSGAPYTGGAGGSGIVIVRYAV